MASRAKSLAAEQMIFRQAELGDRQELNRLWAKVFGDDKAVSDRLLDDFAGWNNIYVACDNDRLIAQLLAVPCSVGKHKGAYLYALATAPEYRGRGVMSGLMEFTQKQVSADGVMFFVLIPASASLFKYYSRLGFETGYMNSVILEKADLSDDDIPTANLSSDFVIKRIPTNIYLKLRNKFMVDGVVTFDEVRTALALEEQWYCGCSSAYSRSGYMIYLKVKDTLFVTELATIDCNYTTDNVHTATDNDNTGDYTNTLTDSSDANLIKSPFNTETARAMISCVMRETGCRTIKITACDNNAFNVRHGKGTNSNSAEINTPQNNLVTRSPQFQFKWWGSGTAPKFYIRFALDELPVRIQKNQDDVID
jgi:predicted N-acetyltransferase YhbS